MQFNNILSESSFKNQYSLQERLNESKRVLTKYPDRIPILCDKAKNTSRDCPYIDKKKYLVPRDLTIGQFLYVVRKRLKLPSEKALFISIGNSIPPTTQMIGYIYDKHKDIDNFLYLNYSTENTFG